MPMQMKIDWGMLETVGAEIIPGGKTCPSLTCFEGASKPHDACT